MDETPEELHRRKQAERFGAQKPTLVSATADIDNRARSEHMLSHLHDEEPWFIFRAQDILSSFALESYLTLLEKFNPSSPQVESCVKMLNEFRAWQQANPQKVKLPD